ncbi:fer-1-like protein 6 [Protopterus annectens]|uniref:fer-1-like protein 6 n=1 Tax=Protopterus annectens TaxID=7888 RepID=UPI001CFAFEC6|nr:fer-1-like protein 6 [Protopterus annectens]
MDEKVAGSLNLNLTSFPRGAKTASQCSSDMLKEDSTKINLFKQKVVRGWWPFTNEKKERDHILTVLVGKVEAELQLFTEEEADKNPVGLGRKEPEPLEKPSRPDMFLSMMCANIRSMFSVFWKNYKKYIIIVLLCFFLALFFFLVCYTLPQAISHKIVNG